MENKRRVKRTQLLKHAKLLAPDSATPVDCMVCDLTNLGAGLRISPDDAVPGNFELILDASASGRKSEVRWNNNERLGVEFTVKK